MVLKEGPMTYRELSTWFGLKNPDSFSRSKPEAKQKKFDKLKLFCDFHFEGKKLVIDRVRIPEYSKAYDIIEERFPDEWGLVIDKNTRQIIWQKEAKVDTCSRVGKAMHHKYPEVQQVKESTAISYVGAVKREKYGRNCIEEHKDWGSCRTVYIDPNTNTLMTEPQMEILKQCSDEAYADVGNQIRKIDESCAMRDITVEEAKEFKGAIDTSNNYDKYQELLFQRLGFIPEKRTQLIDENKWER